MPKNYVVLGAGLQGVAAAYDFARFGDAERVVLADVNEAIAKKAANRVNKLLKSKLVSSAKVNVKNEKQVQRLLKGADVCLSAVPYYFNVALSQIAIAAGCNFLDLGGNTDVVWQQHKLHKAAKKAGVTIAPDCGLAPGMANILAAHGVRQIKNPRRAKIYVGGLPQQPKPPLGYRLFFNIEGLTNEYFGQAHILKNGKLTVTETFTELEQIEFPAPVGKCEAFTTYGGASTCPWTFEGQLEEYFEKTVRYPGHYEKMKTIYDLGLLDLRPVKVDNKSIIPRNVFHEVVGPKLESHDPKDVVVLRVVVEGDSEKVVFDMLDFYDDTTGFTAMQRTTGFGATIVGIMLANGQAPAGSIRLERDIDSEKYIAEMRHRNFDLKIV
jgi:lysine 6-dehydrogenase